MRRIKSTLFFIMVMMGTTAIFTSCQEDAPEINYTVNVSVNNDFTKVVEAINNGTLKQTEAIEKLVAAIDKMNADQAAKLQAIISVINSANATLETKLAAIEAAVMAQTLSLAEKLSLLETAINALPDYSEKFNAVVSALDALKTQIETQGESQAAIAAQVATVTTAINNLIAEVNSGNTDAAAALAEIIAKLEALKEAIGNGGGSTPVFTSTVTLDGVTMPVLSAGIDKWDLEEDNRYDIYLFLSGDKTKYINIMADGEHHNGKTLDLTRKEDEHNGWYWAVEMRNPTRLFQTFGEPGTEYPVFLSGTLQVDRIGTGTEFEITLKNGKVKGEGEYGDGLEHTVSLDFKGELEFDEF
ncbi:hypothetical protein ACMYZ5_01755 [Bacteroides sp. KG68]|uniref:hypothetical protein n=1 Tax=unclassified Bacteroides TaxID=2646097 RepID=UPI003D9A09A5